MLESAKICLLTARNNLKKLCVFVLLWHHFEPKASHEILTTIKLYLRMHKCTWIEAWNENDDFSPLERVCDQILQWAGRTWMDDSPPVTDGETYHCTWMTHLLPKMVKHILALWLGGKQLHHDKKTNWGFQNCVSSLTGTYGKQWWLKVTMCQNWGRKICPLTLLQTERCGWLALISC